MSLTIASIETDIGTAFHAVAAEAVKIASALHWSVAVIDKSAPAIEAIITAVNPAAGAASSAIVGIVNVVDAAVTTAQADAAGGVTLTLPAELVALYKSAAAAVKGYESAL